MTVGLFCNVLVIYWQEKKKIKRKPVIVSAPSQLSSIHGPQAHMSMREFPLLVQPFMERPLSMRQWATKYGEGVALLGPHLTDTCEGINWPTVTFRHPLVYTLKDLVSIYTG